MMDETDDLDVESVSSDYSVLPDAHESEAVTRPYLAANAEAGSISSHNQVEFVNMCSSYPCNQDVAIYYSFTGEHTPSVTDRLALYKVGFTTPQDYLVYEWAPTAPQAASPSSGGTGRIYGVAFSKSGLPRDASEFYQVCYLREDHLIRGVSAPFQLVQEEQAMSSLSSDAVSAIEQPDGSILVSTDLSSLHTNINMLQGCVQRVQAEKVSVEEQLASVQLQLQGKAEQLQHLELKLQELSMSAEKQQQVSAAGLAEKETRLASLQHERDALQESLQAAQEEVDRLQERASQQREEQFKLEDELAQRDQRLQDKDVAILNKEEELSAAVNQLQALEAKQELLCKEMEECQDDRDRARQALSDYTDAAAKDHSHLNVLERELSLVNEELRQQMEELQEEKIALEKSKEELQLARDELDRERSTLTAAQAALDTCRAELRVAFERQNVLDADNRVLQSTVRSHLQLTTQLREKLRESESKCAGAERVAEKLSEAHQDAVQRRGSTERRNKLLAAKCQQLSKLILDQNVSESVEALVNFYDDDEVEEEIHDNETTADREVPPTVTCATVGDTATLAYSDLAVDAELVEDDGSKNDVHLSESSVEGVHIKDEPKPLSPVTEELQAVIVKVCETSDAVSAAADDAPAQGAEAQVTKKLDSNRSTEQGFGAATPSSEAWADRSDASSRSDRLITLATLKLAATRAKQNWEDLQKQFDEFQSETAEGSEARIESLPSTTVQHPETAATPVQTASRDSEKAHAEEPKPEGDAQTKPQNKLENEGEARDQQRGPGSSRHPGRPGYHQPHFQPHWQHPFPHPPPPPPPPSHTRPPPPYFGSVFTAGQTAPVFFPPTMHYHSAPDFGENFHGGRANCHNRSTEPIPMPYPPAFPMPPHPPPPPPFPFMPPPPPPPPPAAPIVNEEDGLPPPLIPNATESSRHAALLSTIGAAAQMASATKLVTDQLKDALGFSQTSGEAAPSSAEQRAADSTLAGGRAEPPAGGRAEPPAGGRAEPPAGTAEPPAGTAAQDAEEQQQQQQQQQQQEQQQQQQQEQQQQQQQEQQHHQQQQGHQQHSGPGVNWRFFQRRPMFSSSFSFSNSDGLSGHAAAHHSHHRGHQQHFHRRAESAPGTAAAGTPGAAAARGPFSGRCYERFRGSHSRDNPRPGMRHRMSFDRMSTNVGGGGHMFEETADDFFGKPNTDAAAGDAAPETEGAAPAEGMDPSGPASASAPPAEEADDGKLHCPFCPYSLDHRNTALFDEHIDSHLEFICPVCSTAFQRSKQKDYEAHVNGHFSEEESCPQANANGEHSSGPWSSLRFMDFD